MLAVAERMKMMKPAAEFDWLLSLLLVEVLRVMHKSNALHTLLVDNVKCMDNVDIQLS